MIAATIKNHRERLGLSPERVAELSKLSRERVLELERDDSGATLSEICALADALAFDLAAVIRGDTPSDPARSAARFRAPHGVQDLGGDGARTLARAAELGRIGGQLSKLLGSPSKSLVPWRSVKTVRNHRRLWQEGYELGESAREHLSPRQEPLRSLQGALEDHQVHVARVPLGDERNIAVSIYEPGAIPVVLLNVAASRVDHGLSRRAVLAHELCHLLHDGGEANLVTLVTRAEHREPVERRANAFAPGFIAPRKWTRATTSASTPIERVREIARTWGLTFEGAAWHAKNSELIEPEVAEELVRRHETIASDCEPTLSRRDPASVGLDVAPSPLVSGLVQDMVVDAYAEGLISRGRAHELLTFA